MTEGELPWRLEDPVVLGRYAALSALSGLSLEAFHSRFQSVGSSVRGIQSKGAAT
jgi:hypothetical protein